MNVWRYIKILWLEEVYSVITLIYLFQLNALNKELLLKNFESPFQLLVYEEWRPIKFFVAALVFFGVGLVISWRGGNRIKDGDFTFCEVFIFIFALILVVTLLILIIVFINNPILRAVMIVCGLGVAILYGDAN